MLRSLRLWLRAVSALVLLVLMFPILLSQGAAPPKRYALVVGINQYDHPDLPRLDCAENDARALAKELGASGYEVVLLVGKEATKKAVEEQLKAVGDRAVRGGKDLFLVALAGHGIQFVNDGEAYFCPVDARPIKERAETLVGMGTVYAGMKSSYAAAKVLLVDACRNDPGVRGRSGVDKNSARAPDGVATLYSCKATQKSCEDSKLGHGLFTYAVLEQMRAAREAGKELKFATLQGEVPERVHELASKLPSQPEQNPEVVAIYNVEPILVPKSSAVVVDAKPLKVPFGEKEILAARTAWAKKLGGPEKKTLDLGGGVKMDLVLIPPGVFRMGSPETEKDREDNEKQHEVELTQAFYMAVTETTQAQYRAITGKNPSNFKGDALPVEHVSWNDAVSFCENLSKTAGAKVILPSEAQWEYACRAGTTSVFHFGDVLNGNKANHDGNAPYGTETKGPYLGKTMLAGDVRYPANGFGLRDMHGNVYEWCLDGYQKEYEGLPRKDPLAGQQKEDRRVLRGGSCFENARNCRAASRTLYAPEFRNINVGFRVVVLP